MNRQVYREDVVWLVDRFRSSDRCVDRKMHAEDTPKMRAHVIFVDLIARGYFVLGVFFFGQVMYIETLCNVVIMRTEGASMVNTCLRGPVNLLAQDILTRIAFGHLDYLIAMASKKQIWEKATSRTRLHCKNCTASIVW